VAQPLALAVLLHCAVQGGNLGLRLSPGGPAPASSADAGDAPVVKKEISFKFVEIRHFRLPAGNTAEQGTENRNQNGHLPLGSSMSTKESVSMTSNSDRDIVRSIEKMILPTLSPDSGPIIRTRGSGQRAVFA
jgi:hypothetical protein